jgi:hypothetical protein
MAPKVALFTGDEDAEGGPPRSTAEARKGPRSSQTGSGVPGAGILESVKRELHELVAKVRTGDAAAIVRLREVLVDNPEVWQYAGDLSAMAEFSWIQVIAKQQPMVGESIKLALAQLKEELTGSAPTRLEKMLVDQIVVCWLELKAIEVTATSDASKERRGRIESAHKRYLDAVKTLTSLRALMPAGLEPLGYAQPFRKAQ